MSMQAYLAANYMSGAKADAILARSGDKKKKRKRKVDTEDYTGGNAAASGSGIRLAEEGDSGWGAADEEGKDEDEGPVVETSKETFIPASKSSWTTIHSGTTPPPEDDLPLDEQPLLVSTSDSPPPAPAPRRGGLRTAAQLRAEEEANAAEELARASNNTEADEHAQKLAQETVYRDGSGKKVDLKAEKAEERRRKKERDEREAKKLEWGKGVVQRGEKEELKRREKEEAGRDLAVYANDASMNREMREESRWNDPAANFLTNRRDTGPAMPKYKGPWATNRFNIPPGHRWDGVDRGNGFEVKAFNMVNSKKQRAAEAYAYGAEDM
ncbi:Pre-mRNA-splicing factor of RES complex-domain-containing protein [Mrakia frigida]|uniref:Bud13p n=1 Tax=Mrakia frigida TaxID=29902 RepID=UPI003FCC18AA